MTIASSMDPRRFLTGAEVATLFRTSESTVRYWKYTGKLPGIRVGRKSLYAVNDVEALIAQAQPDQGAA